MSKIMCGEISYINNTDNIQTLIVTHSETTFYLFYN